MSKRNGKVPPPPPGPRAVLTVTLTADGKIDLTGPLNDFVLSLGLLARAQQMIGERAMRREVAPIEAPPGFRTLTQEEMNRG